MFLNIRVHVNNDELIDESKPLVAHSQEKKTCRRVNQSQVYGP